MAGAGQGRRSAMLALLGTVAILLLSCSGAAAKSYLVGNTTWTFAPGSNIKLYDSWSSQQVFNVGDTLEFKYDNTSHNVATLPTLEAFDNCDVSNAKVQTPNSGDIFINLTANGITWYVCAIPGHCSQGMKVQIIVGTGAAGAPSGSPGSPSGSPGAQAPSPSLAPRLASAISYGTAAAVVISAASFFL